MSITQFLCLRNPKLKTQNPRLMKTRGNPYLFSLLITAAAMSNASLGAAELSLNGTGTVRLLASDWSDYLGGSGSFNSANDWGRVFWRGTSGDGQYIHFDLTRLSGLTVSSAASVTLQNANPTWGGSVDNSFIATANGAWTAGSGTSIPGATAIGDATNATGSYSSGASVTWGIGSATFQGYINNASSFNGLAIIGGSGSSLHFTAPANPYLEVATNANMTGVITVSDDTNWTGKYSFTNGVLSVNDSVSGGNVVINSLGTVAVTEGAYNRYWDVSSTRINSGGVLTIQGHSHLRNLTLAGGELAGIRPDGAFGGWTLDDATTVTGGVTSTISAQRIALDNGTFAVDAGSTLNMTGSIASGSITKNGPGLMRLLSSGMSGTPVNSHTGATVINAGTLEIYGRSADNGGYTSLGTGSVTINNGGTLITANDWALGNEWNAGNVGTVTVNAGGTLTINSAGNTIRNGLVLNGGTVNGTGANNDWGGMYLKSTTVTAGGDAISTISVDTALDTTIAMSVNSGSQLNYSGKLHNQIGSTGGIAKSGAGTLTISGANTYTGNTSLQEGTLRLENTSALGSGTLSMSNGTTLQLRSNSSTTFNGGNGLGGLGGATINFDVNQLTTGNSDQTISFATGGFNTSATTINVTGGNGYSLSLGGINQGFAGSLALNAVSANLSIGNIGSASAVGTLSVGGAARTTITGSVNTNSGIVKTGSGTLNLSGTSSYAGVTTIEGGIVNAASFADNGTESSLGIGTGDTEPNSIGLLFRGGTLQYSGSTAQSTNRSIRLSATGGGGTIDASGSDPSATLSFTASSSSNLFEEPGARTLTLTGTNTGANRFGMALSDAGGATSLVKNGAGTWVLSGSSSHSGNTSLQEGTLRLENTSALGSGTLSMSNGTTLQLRSNSSTTFNGGNGLGGLGGATINFDVNQLATGNTNQTISFATGGFNTFGTTINVTGGNGYSLALGGINEGFNGSLALNAVSANLSIGNIGSASAVSSLSVGGAANTTISGAINTSGGVNKSGLGVLTLSGTSSYTGNTTVSAGKLVINGNISTSTQTTVQSGATLGGSGSVGALSVESGAFINPGNSPGILNAGNYSQAGTFIAEIAGTTPGTEHDQINVTGTVNLSGALDLQFSASQDYVFNSMIFLILNDSNDAVTGTFTGLAQGATAATFGGFDWVISYTANSTNTTFTGGNDVALMAIPEPSAALLGGLGILGLLRRRRAGV